MNTLENNKLIAEFLGYELFKDKYYELSQFGYIKTNGEWSDIFYPTTLKFHKDWNWLMEVVEKIESLGYFFKIVSQTSLIVDKDEKCLSLSVYRKTKIDSTYEACLEFIKWYNAQNS
jgi:hypothetical protein